MSCNETREDLLNEINELKDSIGDVEADLCGLEDEANGLNDRLEEIDEDKNNLNDELDNLMEELKEAESKLKNLKTPEVKTMRNGDYRVFSGNMQIWFKVNGGWTMFTKYGATSMHEDHPLFNSDLNSERKNIFDELKGN